MPKAFIMIAVQPGQEETVHRAIKKMAGVQFSYEVTGEHDIIALVDAEPYEEISATVAHIRQIPGVQATDTEFVLR
jgi:DNA-binding Lrp family transcriptional regulator